MTSHEKSEFNLIEWFRQHSELSCDDVITGIGDDMAVMRTGGEKLLITTDMLLEGIHFDLEKASLEQVGYKAMACSLSDCAAMAAVPWLAVVAVALSQNMSMNQAKHLHQGLQQAAKLYNCPVGGGDVTSWQKPLAINVTMLAKSSRTEPVLRSNAQIGDAIMVTGRLGGSQLGRHLDFTPRVKESQILTQIARLNAMIDISDGLLSDLRQICKASQVSARVEVDRLPVQPAVRDNFGERALELALAGGEDYELLFTASAEVINRVKGEAPCPVTIIGEITEDKPGELSLLDTNGNPVNLRDIGWEHFKNGGI